MIVIAKIGTSSVTDDAGEIRADAIQRLCAEVAECWNCLSAQLWADEHDFGRDWLENHGIHLTAIRRRSRTRI